MSAAKHLKHEKDSDVGDAAAAAAAAAADDDDDGAKQYKFFATTTLPNDLAKKFWCYKDANAFGNISYARFLDKFNGDGYTGDWEQFITPAIEEQSKAIVDGIEEFNLHFWTNARIKPNLKQVIADMDAIDKMKRVNQQYSAHILHCVKMAGLENKIYLRHLCHRLLTGVGKDNPNQHSKPSTKRYTSKQKRKKNKGQLFR